MLLYRNFPAWDGFQMLREIQNFDEYYELKPTKKKLELDVDRLEKEVQSLTSILAEQKNKLEEKKKELSLLNKESK